ncbi:hypothetical protein [Galactobacter sp.]|uniref:phage tail tube protein n=1 Tax=Galactobacter sp. TaxID=2676125 RepID=UPI0025C569FA|nr:hypothetical protein [Galactobacter sp.]
MADALASKLARRFAVEVKPSGAEDTAWVRVKGINSLTPNLEQNFEDSTDFDNDGWTSSEKTSQGWSLALGLIEKVGQTDRIQDPGQRILEQTQDKFGGEGFVDVRWGEREGDVAYTGNAAVQWEPQGGGVTDLSSVNVTLTGNGKRLPLSPNPFDTGDSGDGENAGGGSGE